MATRDKDPEEKDETKGNRRRLVGAALAGGVALAGLGVVAYRGDEQVPPNHVVKDKSAPPPPREPIGKWADAVPKDTMKKEMQKKLDHDELIRLLKEINTLGEKSDAFDKVLDARRKAETYVDVDMPWIGMIDSLNKGVIECIQGKEDRRVVDTYAKNLIRLMSEEIARAEKGTYPYDKTRKAVRDKDSTLLTDEHMRPFNKQYDIYISKLKVAIPMVEAFREEHAESMRRTPTP